MPASFKHFILQAAILGCWFFFVILPMANKSVEAQIICPNIKYLSPIPGVSWYKDTKVTVRIAWLVLDRNGNGLIDNGGELFGNHTAQPDPTDGNARNGFLALAEFDKSANGGNEDGFITKADVVFKSLRLWQDINHNGTTESIELKTLTSLSLAKIELEYKRSRRVDINGSIFLFRAKIKDEKDAQMGRWAWDVVLAKGGQGP